jgi:gliding motility-associated lipoprotein GldD
MNLKKDFLSLITRKPHRLRLMRFSCYFLVLCLLAVACRQNKTDDDFMPKPKGYNRIDLPVATYQALKETHPYTFEYSKYAVIKPDTVPWAEPHWIYVYYPDFKAVVQLTYKSLGGDKQKLARLIDDAHRLAAKHNIKAYSIQEMVMKTKTGKTASLIELQGEVPTYLQFYVTDSTQHYLRGALYFNSSTQSDSLSPVIDYLKKDVVKMLNTLKWQR